MNLTSSTPPLVRAVAGGALWTDHSLLTLVLDHGGAIVPELSLAIEPQHRLDRMAGSRLFRSSYREAQVDFAAALGRQMDAPRLSGLVAGVVSTPAAAFNFGHWILEVLPSLAEIHRQFGGVNRFRSLILPSLRWSWQRETMELLGIALENLVALDEASYVQCELLVSVPFPRPSWDVPAWLPGAIRGLFSMLMPDPHLPRRIYLSRRDVGRRQADNERELLQVLKRAGYQEVVLSEMPLGEQIVCIMSASHIASIHGSALDLTVFCTPGTKVIEIFGRTGPFPEHEQIATHLSCEYWGLVSSETKISSSGDQHWSNFKADVRLVAAVL